MKRKELSHEESNKETQLVLNKHIARPSNK